jgi:hypothetical protein
MKKILLKQELYKTYWYFHFRLRKKPNLKKLKALIEQTNNLKFQYNDK